MSVTVEPVDGVPGVYSGRVDIAIDGSVAADESYQIRASLADTHRRAAMSAIDLTRRSLSETDD